MKREILDLTQRELGTLLLGWGQPQYRARQVFWWLYRRFVFDFGEMTNLPLKLRKQLDEEFEVCKPDSVETLVSESDCASKSLVKLHDGNMVESVLIPAERRLTLCISTQVGCKFGCKFCASGAEGFTRSLSSGEIIAQILLGMRIADPWRITHIVVMGMGEPMDNLENTLKAVEIMCCESGLDIGSRRVTVSTIGVADTVEQIIERIPQVGLSFSLHAPSDEIREQIVPANRAFPVASILSAAKTYFKATRRLPTFEYILIDGLNSEPSHAKALAALLRKVRCKVNLIPFNETCDSDFSAPSARKAARFLSILEKSDVKATIRHSRGGDIAAACGQLASQKSKVKDD